MNDSKSRRFRDRSSGPATLINDGCKITGLVAGSGDVHVSGHIDGDCDLEGTVSLAKNGYWNGTIKAGNVVVAGHVEGDIIASGRVEITETARIAGTVAAEAIAVAEGAIVEGVMKTSTQAEPTGFIEKRHED
ncbi:MAG: polymer-forming cytoskeletal protein [Gammaproteobacteria bacterium]|nr:polymer-forming cytoskeletal protein [Gammaproteobacteria bacterium]